MLRQLRKPTDEAPFLLCREALGRNCYRPVHPTWVGSLALSVLEDEFLDLSIAESLKCRSEDGRIHPNVGAVAVKDGKVLASAYRGETAPGDHAEYVLLEKKLANESLAGCTIYTTLEPCTSRNYPKVPCAQRLIDRKVGRVVIGQLDPNPIITGRGKLALRSAGIITDLYPESAMKKVEEINRHFNRFQAEAGVISRVSSDFIESAKNRRLDHWYESVNRV